MVRVGSGPDLRADPTQEAKAHTIPDRSRSEALTQPKARGPCQTCPDWMAVPPCMHRGAYHTVYRDGWPRNAPPAGVVRVSGLPPSLSPTTPGLTASPPHTKRHRGPPKAGVYPPGRQQLVATTRKPI